ncbi:MAG: helix-turn-helix domain-containing protein [Planctomycetes bacterium]|nr:helix-turn-helix domain-containing protein [Planctomycetota bacterium]
MRLNVNDAKAMLADLPSAATTREVCAVLRVCSRTVRRWLVTGKISGMKTSPGRGGRLLISKASLERLLVGGCT